MIDVNEVSCSDFNNNSKLLIQYFCTCLTSEILTHVHIQHEWNEEMMKSYTNIYSSQQVKNLSMERSSHHTHTHTHTHTHARTHARARTHTRMHRNLNMYIHTIFRTNARYARIPTHTPIACHMPSKTTCRCVSLFRIDWIVMGLYNTPEQKHFKTYESSEC